MARRSGAEGGVAILGFTCLKDDGPYLVEWLAHHLAAGFDRMLVLTHDCNDGSDALMQALAQDDRIVHLPFTPGRGASVQWQALALAGRHQDYRAADWALFFDVDEFVCLDGPADVPALLGGVAGDAVALPWRLFGSGGQARRGDGLTPERFARAAPAGLHFPLAHLFKTLHRPSAFQKPGVHRPRARRGEAPVWHGPDGAPLPPGFAAAPGAISLYGVAAGAPLARLNHYSLRSTEEFVLKRARGLPNHMDRDIGMTYWVERNWNDVEDRGIEAMLPATRARLARLMALPGVADAHAACLAAHNAHHARLVQDLDVVRFAFRLGLAGDSVAPDAAAARQLLAATAAAGQAKAGAA